MICKDIINVIEQDYPRRFALEWDNVGLLAGRTGKDVSTIYVALDATDEVILEAIELGVDMLITHHPLIFTPMKSVTDEEFVSSRLVNLIQNDISYYAMHTNYDVLRMGELAGEKLGIHDAEILEHTYTENEKKYGIGIVSDLLNPTTIREYCEIIKNSFSVDTVKVFGDLDRVVKRIAISPGSGKHMTEEVLKCGGELLITGDIDHHEGIDAVAQGVTIIDAGHYGIEKIFIEDMAKYLNKKFESVEVKRAIDHSPFRVV